jgi:NADH-quinone oxidoreductase subunit N
MSAHDLILLLPVILIAATAILLMLIVAIKRSHQLTFAVSLIGIVIAFISLWPAAQGSPRPVSTLLVIDQFALFYMGLLLASTAAILLYSYSYLDAQQEHKEEFYILVLLAVAGGMVLVASSHFISFFLGLEILSIALYGLVAYLRTGSRPLEAGMKYLVLASSSAAFLLFGMALIYSETGSLEFGWISSVFRSQPATNNGLLLAGAVLMMTGIGFKLALVPFHLWTPDVYQGAPLPVAALVATVSKASVFALLLRWLHPFSGGGGPLWIVLAVSAVASMLAGNLLALFQSNVKRILAYSSIAHMGYFFVAILAAGSLGFEAATYYLIAYLVTITGAFAVLTVICSEGTESCEIVDFRGLFWHRPVLTGVFTAMLLSLAGIPLTAGFLGKFYVLTAGVSSETWGLVFVLIISSVIGLFYYLRIVVALYAPARDDARSAQRHPTALPAVLSLTALAVFLVCFGVYPTLLWRAVALAVDSLNRS